MSSEDFKQGYEAAGQANRVFMEKQAAATEFLGQRIIKKIDKLGQIIDVVVNDLDEKEKREIYHLQTSYDISKLEQTEKEILVSYLYTLMAKHGQNVQGQQEYFLAAKKHLGISEVTDDLELSSVENIDSRFARQAMCKTVLEFLFIQTGNESIFEKFTDEIQYFDLNQKDYNAIIDEIQRIYDLMGLQGIIEHYNPSSEENNANNNELSKEQFVWFTLQLDFGSIAARFGELTISLGTKLSGKAYNLPSSGVCTIFCDEKIQGFLDSGMVDSPYLQSAISDVVNHYDAKNDPCLSVAVATWGPTEEETDGILVFNLQGVFYQSDENTVFFRYADIVDIKDSGNDEIEIELLKISDVGERLIERIPDGNHQKCCIFIEDDELRRTIRKRIDGLAVACGKPETHIGRRDDIETIVEKHIKGIANGKEYYIGDGLFENENLLHNVEKSYFNLQWLDVVAVVNEAVLPSHCGKNSLVFTEEGIFVKPFFKKMYFPFDSIRMALSADHKSLRLMANGFDDTLDNGSYGLKALYDCIKEIKQII